MLGGVMLISGYDFSVVQAIIISRVIPLLRYSSFIGFGCDAHSSQFTCSPENVSDERAFLSRAKEPVTSKKPNLCINKPSHKERDKILLKTLLFAIDSIKKLELHPNHGSTKKEDDVSGLLLILQEYCNLTWGLISPRVDPCLTSYQESLYYNQSSNIPLHPMKEPMYRQPLDNLEH
jgi:hypothetical protein